MPIAFARQLGQTIACERILARALLAVGDRHAGDAEIRSGTRTLAAWSTAHVLELRPLRHTHGHAFGASEMPRRIRSELFHGFRVGATGLLHDLADLGLLAFQTQQAWEALKFAANAAHDAELDRLCVRALEENWRQRSWITTSSRHASGQALLSSGSPAAKAKGLLPKSTRIASLLDCWWQPAASAMLIGAVGVAGWLLQLPILVASLGPSAWLVGERSAHPSSGPWPTVIGHAVAIAAGFAAVALTGTWSDPATLSDHVLSGGRVAAATIAIALTAAALPSLKASHPPAAATALLVALGSITDWRSASLLLAGAVCLAILGEGLRRLRLGRADVAPSHPAPIFAKSGPEADPLLQPATHPGTA